MTKETYPVDDNTVKLGPRVEHDIRRRIREIEGLWPAVRTRQNWHELGRLRQLLRLVETRGRRQ